MFPVMDSSTFLRRQCHTEERYHLPRYDKLQRVGTPACASSVSCRLSPSIRPFLSLARRERTLSAPLAEDRRKWDLHDVNSSSGGGGLNRTSRPLLTCLGTSARQSLLASSHLQAPPHLASPVWPSRASQPASQPASPLWPSYSGAAIRQAPR